MEEVRAITQALGRHFPEAHDGFLSQTIAEIFLPRIAAKVFEGQHRQHDARPVDLEWRRNSGDGICPALETVALTLHCLDVPGFLRVFAESAADLSDCCVNAIVGDEENIFAPQAFDNFIAAHQSSIFAD
jgi:hypothetical protein